MKFVIIGADAAGMSAASRARRNMPGLEIIVFEKTFDVSYSACGMPYNIAEKERDINDLVVRSAQAFREKQGLDLRLGHEVTAIDRAAKVVRGRDPEGRDFEQGYDKLLIATGAAANTPPGYGFDLPGVLSLKSLADGRAIKAYMARHGVKKVVCLGMGYIALEMSEAFRARGVETHLIKPDPGIVPWLAEELGEMVRAELEANGVVLHPGRAVKGVVRAGKGLVVEAEGLDLEADMVLTAIGVHPASRLAGEAGLELGPRGAVAIDRAAVTSDPDILSAGDCADAFHVVTGQRVYIPLALRANRAGYAAADTATGKKARLPDIAGTSVFKLFGLEVARTGLTGQEAANAGFEPVAATITSRTKAHAHAGAGEIKAHLVADKGSGRLLGGFMVGQGGAAHRINALAVALAASFTAWDFYGVDTAYAPPFSPVWDPMLVAANQLIKKL